MTKIEALELELAARKMLEGTDFDWWGVIRHKPSKDNLINMLETYRMANVELALGIVEGKPVWEGDKLYFPDGGSLIADTNTPLCVAKGGLFDLSWNPPKPKTVMVELSIKTANLFKTNSMCSDCEERRELAEACRKALENLK